MLRLFRSLSRFETQDIKTQPQFNHYLIKKSWAESLTNGLAVNHKEDKIHPARPWTIGEQITAEDSLKGNELLAPVFSHSATKGASVGWKENYFVNIHPTVL